MVMRFPRATGSRSTRVGLVGRLQRELTKRWLPSPNWSARSSCTRHPRQPTSKRGVAGYVNNPVAQAARFQVASSSPGDITLGGVYSGIAGQDRSAVQRAPVNRQNDDKTFGRAAAVVRRNAPPAPRWPGRTRLRKQIKAGSPVALAHPDLAMNVYYPVLLLGFGPVHAEARAPGWHARRAVGAEQRAEIST